MKNKPLLIIIITCVVVAGIIMFLIKPVISSVLTSWKDLSQAKENLKTVEEKKQVLESLKTNQDLTKVADIAEKYIPKEENSGQLVIELTAMAQSNNLKIEQTSIEKAKNTATTDNADTTGKATPSPSPNTSATPDAASQIKTVDFTEKLNGSYPDFINFLKAVETGSRLILIKNISMQTKIEAGKPMSFNIDISGSAYYKTKISIEQNLNNIKITEETLTKFLNLKSYGQPINLPGESGFGRPNPFENY